MIALFAPVTCENIEQLVGRVLLGSDRQVHDSALNGDAHADRGHCADPLAGQQCRSLDGAKLLQVGDSLRQEIV